MPTDIRKTDFRPVGDQIVQTAYVTLSAPGEMDWVQFVTTDVVAQIEGAATSVTAIVERSVFNPYEQVTNGAPAAEPITGNPATGISPSVYVEPALGWWRVRLTAISGGSATISLSGGAVG